MDLVVASVSGGGAGAGSTGATGVGSRGAGGAGVVVLGAGLLHATASARTATRRDVCTARPYQKRIRPVADRQPQQTLRHRQRPDRMSHCDGTALVALSSCGRGILASKHRGIYEEQARRSARHQAHEAAPPKQQVSRVRDSGAVTGAGEISGLISGAPSAIGSASWRSTPTTATTGRSAGGSPREALWKRDHQNSGAGFFCIADAAAQRLVRTPALGDNATDVDVLRARLRAIVERPEITSDLHRVAGPRGRDRHLVREPKARARRQGRARARARYFSRMCGRATPVRAVRGLLGRHHRRDDRADRARASIAATRSST